MTRFESQFESKFSNIKFRVIADDEHYCKYCLQLLDDVYQADCGCRFCLNCFNYRQNSLDGQCFVCNEISDSTVKVKDKAFQKVVDNLLCKCDLCFWSGKISELVKHYEEHPKDCDYKNIGCNSDHLNEDLDLSTAKHIDLVYENIHEKLNRLEKGVENIQLNNEKVQTSFEEPQNNNEYQDRMNEIEKTSVRLRNTIKINLESVYNLTKKHDESNKKLMKEDVSNMQKKLLSIESSSIMLDERLCLLESGFYNGTLLWKIDNFKEKKEKEKFLNSPFFYTSTYGYKLCARLYLNGDGQGLKTHLSLFVIILKGDYDELLSWPFKNKITFILIDQNHDELKENIVESFKPEKNSISFEKPKNYMNVPSGISLFCRLDKIMSENYGYVKDDCMFIKIIVDSRDSTF